MLTRAHLEAYLEVVEHRSIQGAAQATGRSRATYNRYLAEIRRALNAPVLIRRAPGQRQGQLTPAGEVLARRAQAMLRRWDQWVTTTRDALGRAENAIRVGALAGSFDLLAELLVELKREDPAVHMKVVELVSDRLIEAVASGEVDFAFGTAEAQRPPRQLSFEPLGVLEWAVILPAKLAKKFPDPIRLADLDAVPLVVHRSGPARTLLARQFALGAQLPLTLDAAFEVESTPRMVDMVARGFGPAIVSQFRLAFLPKGIVVRRLLDGPRPLRAGIFKRRSVTLTGPGKRLVERAHARFDALALDHGTAEGRR